VDNTAGIPLSITSAKARYWNSGSGLDADDELYFQFYDYDAVDWITISTYNSGSPIPTSEQEFNFVSFLTNYFEAAANKTLWVNALAFRWYHAVSKAQSSVVISTQGVEVVIEYLGSPSDPGTDNLIALFKCNDPNTSSVIADSSATNNDGQYQADTTPTNADAVSGLFTNSTGAIDFDYADEDVIRVPSHASYNTGTKLSGAIWAIFDSFDEAGEGLMSKAGAAVDERGWIFNLSVGVTDHWKLRLAVSSNGTDMETCTTVDFVIELSTLYHLAFAYNAGEIYLFVNGVRVSTVNSGTIPTSLYYNADVNLLIGARLDNSPPSNNIDGRLDTAALYNDVLTYEEIVWLYNSGDGREDIGPSSGIQVLRRRRECA